MSNITEDRRRELVEEQVTLDGKKAVIGGVKNSFASVTQLPDGPSYDWAWETVDHIVRNRNGEFHS